METTQENQPPSLKPLLKSRFFWYTIAILSTTSPQWIPIIYKPWQATSNSNWAFQEMRRNYQGKTPTLKCKKNLELIVSHKPLDESNF